MYRQPCPYCDRLFYNEYDFNHHLMVIHGQISIETKSEPIKSDD